MEVVINWWAILASMVISIALGFVWYGPLFGKRWIKLSGIVMSEVNPEAKIMIKPMIFSLIGAFIMSYTLTHGIVMGNVFFNTSGVSAGLMGAFWYWLGFVVPVYLNLTGWEGKSWTLFAINTGYWLVFLLASGAIIAGWQ